MLHDDDLRVLLRVVERGSTFLARRDAAMVRVLLDTGCRRGELVGIDLDDVDLRTQDLALRRTKGGHERQVPIGAKTALAVRKYLRLRARHPAVGSPALFLSTRASSSGRWRLSGDAVASMLLRRGQEAVLERMHPHMFRHTWANDLLVRRVASDATTGSIRRIA